MCDDDDNDEVADVPGIDDPYAATTCNMHACYMPQSDPVWVRLGKVERVVFI